MNDALVEHLGNHLNVVHQARHQIACVVLIEEAERQALDSLEDLRAHAQKNLLAGGRHEIE